MGWQLLIARSSIPRSGRSRKASARMNAKRALTRRDAETHGSLREAAWLLAQVRILMKDLADPFIPLVCGASPPHK